MNRSKLIQYISLPLLAAMFSCSNDVEKSDIPVIVPLANEITFSVGSVSDSRATIMDNSNFVADGRTIGIYANKHKGNLSNSAFDANVMKNEELVYSNDIWSYSPMQYWSNSQDTLYSFVAYSPYHVNASIKDNNVVIPYDCAVKNNEQVDLLWGVTKDIYTPNNPVLLNFKHALSKVVFNVDGFVNGSDISNVEINNVIITGLANSADFSVNAYSNESSWSNYTNVANVLVSNESLILTNSKSQIREPLLLIPQELTNAKLIVEYDIYSESVGDYDSKRVEFALSTSTTVAWSANKTYTYNLHLDLNAIEFSLSVHISDFETETEVDVELPNDGKAYTLMYYKSTDGQIVEPYNLDAFDAKLISNTYEDGQGTMMFEGVLTEIGDNAFNFYGNLYGIVIPKTVSDIAPLGLACDNLEEISVDSENKYYDSRDNCNAIIETESNTLIAGCLNTIIPNSVVSIRPNAFCLTKLTSISIPESVTTIYGLAFQNSSMEELFIPASVTYIEGNLFCGSANMERIKVDENNAYYDSRENCNAIIETESNTLIAGCSTTIIPENIVAIGEEAFYGGILYGGILTTITIPESVIEIGGDAFCRCNLSVIRVNATLPPSLIRRDRCREDGYYYSTWPFDENPLNVILVPMEAVEDYKNAEGWSEYADLIVGFDNAGSNDNYSILHYQSIDGRIVEMSNTQSYSNVLISNTYINKGTMVYDGTLERITWGAFKDNTDLLNITFPSTVCNIGDYAFSGCSNLERIDIPNPGYVDTHIGSSAFSDCVNLVDLYMPEGVSYIGSGAFSNCPKLLYIVIPSSVKDIVRNPFANCSGIISIIVNNNNNVYDSRDNCNAIIETATNTLVVGNCNTIIPTSVTAIGYEAFCGCVNLRSIVIPENVVTIGESAFGGCVGLTAITMHNSLTSIEDYAFQACSDLTSIVIPENVVTIGQGAFWRCADLTTVTVLSLTPPMLDEVNGTPVFESCDNLVSIQVPIQSVELYKNADGWSEYADLIVGIE